MTALGHRHGPIVVLAGGTTSHVYANQDLVARVHPSTAADHARQQVDVARQLVAAGVPVIEPVGTVTEIDGFVVTLWVRERPGGPLDPEAFGAAVRRLHDAPVTLVADVRPTLEVAHAHAAFEDLAQTGRLARRSLQVLAYVITAAAPLLDGVVVVTHGDLWPRNVLSAARGPVLAELDTMSPGPAVHDLALALHAADYVSAAVIGPHDPIDAVAFSSGYGAPVPGPADRELVVAAHDAARVPLIVARGDDPAPRIERLARTFGFPARPGSPTAP